MKKLIWYRRSAQLLVLGLFCVLPWLKDYDVVQIRGSLFSFEAFGVPFADPASTLQILLPPVQLSNILSVICGAALCLVLASILGRFFCGWICPYGFFSELIYKLRDKFHWAKFNSLSPYNFHIKCLIFLIGLIIAFVTLLPVITWLSMPGQLSVLPQIFKQSHPFSAILLIPSGLLFLEFISGSRIFCIFICPQSVLLGAMAHLFPQNLPGFRIALNKNKCICKKKFPCTSACSLNLNPRKQIGPKRRDCSMCGNCVNACAHNGKALNFTFMNNS